MTIVQSFPLLESLPGPKVFQSTKTKRTERSCCTLQSKIETVYVSAAVVVAVPLVDVVEKLFEETLERWGIRHSVAP